MPVLATTLSLAINTAIAASQAMPVPVASLASGHAVIAEEPGSSADRVPDEQELYLEVSVNQDAGGQLARFVVRGEDLYASAATLRQLGLRWPGSDEQAGLVALQSVPGIRIDYDIASQRLALQVPVEQLATEATHLGFTQPERPRLDPASQLPGLVLNYDLYGQRGEDYQTLNGFSELRLFGVGPGVWGNSLSNRLDSGDAARYGRHHSVRLDTSWQLDLPDRMLSLTVGDTVTGALDWTRSTRIGGIHLGRNFSLQPYRITTPLASFAGQATLPSTVDIYINGLKQSSQDVRPGRFQIDSIPSLNGVGQAQMVVTDINGQSRTVGFTLYGTPDLLQQGLSDWSLDLGVVREQYGLQSFAYGSDPLVSASGRHGLRDWLTLEGHVEANADVQQAGMGAVLLLGERGGVLNASLAGSRGPEQDGHQYGLAYQWNSRIFSTSLSTLRRSEGFQDVATLTGADLPRRTDQAYAGVSTPLGQWGVSYVAQQYSSALDSRYATLNWSRQLPGNSTLNISLNRDLENDRRDSAFIYWSLPLDRYTSFSTSGRSSRDANSLTVEANRTTPSDLGGWGWRAQASVGDTRRGQAQLSQLGRYGQWTAGVDHMRGNQGAADTTTAYASASGGLALLQGRLYPMRRVDDAFALVSTDGVAGVPVKLENRLVGQTDEHGLLLINRLNAWQNNLLSIDPMDLPADMQIAHTRMEAVPASRSGLLARFPMHRTLALELALVDAAGQWLPAGSAVSLRAADDPSAPLASTVVGHEGMVYLEDPPPGAVLEVRGSQLRCTVQLPTPPAREGRLNLGTLECR